MHGAVTANTEHVDTEMDEIYLSRPLRGQGGYQSLLARLQSNMNGTRLRLTRDDCERVVRYATQYGQGGFQERLRSIVQLAEQFDT